jgi:putative sigma-54 modulation protein
MKITVQSIHFTADQKLLDFINTKLNKLDQFFDHIIEGSVFLKLDKAENDENKIFEIKLMVPGNTLFAKYQSKSFEEACDHSIDSMSQQIKKHKEKVRNRHADKDEIISEIVQN